MTANDAWDQMRYLAQLLRDRKPIPDDLADFLADAIEASEAKTVEDKKKAKAFTDELGLTANNRRKIDFTAADAQLERDFGMPGDAYPSQSSSAVHTAEKFMVSRSTVINRLREADESTRSDIELLRRSGGGDQ